jgi:hypothetical protein
VSRQKARHRAPIRRLAGPAVAHFEITGKLDDYGAAALRLEIEELARRLGARIKTFQFEPAGAERSE